VAGDPWQHLAGVTVLPDPEALIAWTADRVHPTLDGLVEQVHRATGYGRQPLWNLVADTLLGPSAAAAARAGRDAAVAHDNADALLDALVVRGPRITRRGSLCAVQADGTRSSGAAPAACTTARAPRPAPVAPFSGRRPRWVFSRPVRDLLHHRYAFARRSW
jgi:hypothetical protein